MFYSLLLYLLSSINKNKDIKNYPFKPKKGNSLYFNNLHFDRNLSTKERSKG